MNSFSHIPETRVSHGKAFRLEKSLCGGLIAVLSAATGCGTDEPAQVAVPNGDAKRGLELIQRYGCGGCHIIPSVPQARGQVGPPLTGIARRAYLGGVLPNTPDNMLLWIRAPQSFEPGSAMPNLGVSESEARDITAYLYSK